MASDVRVSVEALQENQVQEVSLDGQETYVQPLSMSENLAKLAHRIDFSQEDSDGEVPLEPGEEEEEEEEERKKQEAHWPWESIRDKLRTSLVETNVLLDVLKIAKDKKYMVLDPVSQEPQPSKPVLQYVAKKESLSGAADILQKGADRLAKSQAEFSSGSRGQGDFHRELLKLRQYWRLRRAGNNILGDLSFKSAGSHYWHSGVFEVVKTREEGMAPGSSPLEVRIPSDLEGNAYIQVVIEDQLETIIAVKAALLPNSRREAAPGEPPWNVKLEAAQNVLFCKELFAQLAREAVQMKSTIPHLVVGNQITSQIFPGVQLSIALCHNTVEEDSKDDTTSPQRCQHNHVLEHALHQMLREVHRSNLNPAPPHPVTAPFGSSKKRRVAGPQGLDRKQCTQLQETEGLLERLEKQAKHTLLRARILDMIDKLAQEVNDPCLQAHVSSIGTSTESSVRIIITSPGYEQICKTMLHVNIGVEDVKVVSKDGKVITLSYDEHELRDLLLHQACQHQVNTVQSLSKMMGWQILHLSNHVGTGPVEKLGNASGIMMASPKGDRVISVRNSPSLGPLVSVQLTRQKGCETWRSDVIKDTKWDQVGGSFKPVQWDKAKGRNFVNKIELLMGCLT
ncbi:mediator of RNA polymerase II transcription subunit 17-like isoform X1 [Branchiostoma floridae x Branchiostoma japonicum]